jgi:dihydropteroate synthase
MGVLNVTPDSFSDGGRFLLPEAAHQQIHTLINGGADIIDIGAESTRPGALPVSPQAQIARLAPIIESFKPQFAVALSVDTTSAEVAEYALERGADIINDVSGLRFDKRMAGTVAKYNATLILNHSRDTPNTMQDAPTYTDVVSEVIEELRHAVQTAQDRGVTQLIIDPGIGFGKTLAHNLALLRHLNQLKTLGFPLLVGTSRKSFIAQLTQQPDPERLEGTVASSLWAIHHGATIVRVHDVTAMHRAITVWRAIQTGLEP